MGIGNRISELRKKNKFSQEYIAEKMDVSRQAVSKWEQGQTSPDTDNLIKLAELFNVPVEYLATGKESNTGLHTPVPKRPFKIKAKRKHIIFSVAILLLCLLIGVAIRIYTLPVSWDAGACGGGYVTHIFDKYSETLVQKYLNGSSEKDSIISIEAVPGTQEAEWESKTIYLHFDIQYEHNAEGIITERVTFIGQRYWFDCFKWGGAMIVG